MHLPSSHLHSVTVLKPHRKFFAVLPAYNEAQSVRQVIQELFQLKKEGIDIEPIVVDDGSTDQTRNLALKEKVNVLSLPFNTGIGLCVQTGFTFALELGADYVLQVDADGQHIPSEIKKLLSLVLQDKTDVVIGSRYSKKKNHPSTTLLRSLASLLLSKTIFLLTGQKITDTTSGFRIFNKRAAEFVAQHYPDDYPEVEILVLLLQNGFRIAEASVDMRSRQHGRSSINAFKSVYYIIKVIFASLMNKVRI